MKGNCHTAAFLRVIANSNVGRVESLLQVLEEYLHNCKRFVREQSFIRPIAKRIEKTAIYAAQQWIVVSGRTLFCRYLLMFVHGLDEELPNLEV